MKKDTKTGRTGTQFVADTDLPQSSDASVETGLSKGDMVGRGVQKQGNAYKDCIRYGGINRCFDLGN